MGERTTGADATGSVDQTRSGVATPQHMVDTMAGARVPDSEAPTWMGPAAPASSPGAPPYSAGAPPLSQSWQGTLATAPATLGDSASASGSGRGAREEHPGLAPGTIVGGHYRVEGILGAGAMGVVYLARHLRLDRAVALKLQRSVGQDAARLEREARAMARLDHPNVVGVYDVGSHDGEVFIAMEFVDGSSLRAWLAQAMRPWQATLAMCVQAGRGLAAAHAAGIVHRDFKPDNVLVGRDGRVRVADFGVARGVVLPELRHTLHEPLGPDLTQTGSIAGTPAYMAPEQFDGHADHRSDVFAFCIVVYEALWGVRPFLGSSLPELVSNVVQGRLRAIPASSPVPPEVIRALLGGLATDPRMRTASIALLLEQLQRATVPKRSAAVVPAIVGASIAVLGLAGTTAWWVASTRETPAVTAKTEPREGIFDQVRDHVHDQAHDDADERPTPQAPERSSRQATGTPVVPAVQRDDDDDDPSSGEAAVDADPALTARRALADIAAGSRDVDPDDLDAAFELDTAEVLGSVTVGLAKGAAAAYADESDFKRPAWDGKTTLMCSMGDKFRFENETFELEGTAFMAMYGCRMQLIGCTVTADTVIQMMTRSEVIIAGGTLRAKDVVIDNLGGEATVSNATVLGRPTVGFTVTSGVLALVETTVAAATVIEATTRSRVTVVRGRLEGTTAAIHAASFSTVVTDDTVLVGPTEISSGAEVISAEKAAARAAAAKQSAKPDDTRGSTPGAAAPKTPASKPDTSPAK